VQCAQAQKPHKYFLVYINALRFLCNPLYLQQTSPPLPYNYNITILIQMSLVRIVKLRVPCGTAKPGPAIGQALGPLGVNMAEFCKQFNEKSQQTYKKELVLNVCIHVKSDRSFTLDVRSPPVTSLIKRVVGMTKGPADPTNPVAYITPEAVYEIAKIKQQDDHLWHLPLEGLARSVVGTCKSMGVQVREDESV
jgi:large subunit ribosomal protein L11